MRDSICIFFRWRKKIKVATSFRTGCRNCPLDSCTAIGSNPHSSAKEKWKHRMVFPFFWQRMRDSNPRKRSQSPVCYRYTNPLCDKHETYYTQAREKVKCFFPFLAIFPRNIGSLSRFADFIRFLPREKACPLIRAGANTGTSPFHPYPAASSG